MSKTFEELTQQALAVRDHYDELQVADGHKKWNAQDRMAGFVGDVGDLSKLVMAKYGVRRGPEDIDSALAHELGVDLEVAFTHTMKKLHEQIEKEKAEA